MEVSGRTELQAAPYAAAAGGPADITISCDARRVLELNPTLESLDSAEYLATGLLFARELLRFDGSYLHASAVILDGKAYLFSANSGTGKSTHAEKWCRLFGAAYLNDDKPVLRLIDGTWMAFGTPWSGKYDLSSPVGVPLAGIAFLERGEDNSIHPAEPGWAVPRIMNQSLWKLSAEQMERQLALVDRLVGQIPVWKLTCRNDDGAAYVAHCAMTGGNITCKP